MINEQGGVNGRKITLISLDDGYSPPKTVEVIRKLVEEDKVLAILNPLGTAGNVVIQKYLNAKKVPQLFVGSGAVRFYDPAVKWTMGWFPSYYGEGVLVAKFLLKNRPDARIGMLSPNDDLGRDYVKGVKDGLGDQAAKMLVKEVTYETTDATVDSQVLSLKDSGADTFLNMAVAKFAAQAIRKAYDSGWKPYQYLSATSSSIAGVVRPAGVEQSTGIITSAYLNDPNDPAFRKTQAYADFVAFMKKYYPEGDPNDQNNGQGYAIAQTMVQVLKQCGDELTRENVMKQAASLKDFHSPMLMDGIVINTSATDYKPVEDKKIMRFDGTSWVQLEAK
jgi:branched-chain amino acid transport system substrate-binding protein